MAGAPVEREHPARASFSAHVLIFASAVAVLFGA
jgi:hypothetical protein